VTDKFTTDIQGYFDYFSFWSLRFKLLLELRPVLLDPIPSLCTYPRIVFPLHFLLSDAIANSRLIILLCLHFITLQAGLLWASLHGKAEQ